MISRLLDFLLAVAEHGFFWIGLALMIEPYLEGFAPNSWKKLQAFLARKPQRRQHVFGVVGALAIIFGCFQAFDEVKSQLRQANEKLEQISQRTAIKDRLQQFYVDVGPLIERPLPKDISEEDFNKYVDETTSWMNKTAHWIETHMGVPARERFLDLTGMQFGRYLSAINDRHNSILANLTRLRVNLRALIESSAWDQHSPS
jgi:hypothetical protein